VRRQIIVAFGGVAQNPVVPVWVNRILLAMDVGRFPWDKELGEVSLAEWSTWMPRWAYIKKHMMGKYGSDGNDGWPETK